MPIRKAAVPALRTTPWRRRTPQGVYFGHGGSVWAYYELPLAPLKWEDGLERLNQGRTLDLALAELGDTSADIANGLAALAALREVHIFCVSFEETLTPPATPTPQHEEFLGRVLPGVTAGKTLLLGVKLWNQVKRGMARGGSGAGTASTLWKQTKTVLSRDVDSEDSFTPYRDDFADINDIMRRAGATVPRQEALTQLESWFNFGAGPDAQILVAPTQLHVTHAGNWELSAVTEFEQPTLNAPDATWLMDAMTHSDPAVAVSIRAELLPATILRAQLRTSQRKLRAAEEEEAKTGDISRDEISSRADLAKSLENQVLGEGRAWLSKASILLARAVDPHEESTSSYRDALRNGYGIETKPLEHRQLRALEEMQPCATVRANPFDQTLSIPLVAYAGLASFSNIGDSGPLWLGEVDPDGSPVYIEAAGAPRNDKPPVMTIFGDPGSGKTFVAQLLAGQAALSGTRAVMINPKGFSSLKNFADWLNECGTAASVVSLSALEGEDGAFDPFRFAPPRMAAEILNRHILTVLGVEYAGGLTGPQEVELGAGLIRGAEAGARCAFDALQHVESREVIDIVVGQARASSLFRLGFGFTPQPAFQSQGTGLTLIEFDRELPFPEPGMPPGREERIALGAMRLVTRASMEILMQAGGGLLVVDEAHHYLNSAEGTASLQRLGREGRSLGLLPIFLTQRVSDLLGAEMENYISRVMVMKLTDAQQSEAALRLCGLEPTQARIDFLREAGPRAPGNGQPGRPSLGFFRDIHDRHAVVSVGPIPEDIRLAFSTNPDDIKRRAALLAPDAGTPTEDLTS